MDAPLDRTEVVDRLELLEAAAAFLTAIEAREHARRKLLRLARRITTEPALTDEEVVPLAYRLALEVTHGR